MSEAVMLGGSVRLEREGPVAILSLDRPAKRNALNHEIVSALGDFFGAPPTDVRAAVLTTTSEHFSAGLDLSELREASVFEGVMHSRGWHRPFDAIERGTIPVVAMLRGAVIGGGLELALATHIRVAEPSAFYALPEGSRGIFVGGGASVRLPRIVGVACMADMMLTGRVVPADEGHRLGISQYLVEEGAGLAKAVALAHRIAENAPATNFSVIQALPRIAEMSPSEGLFVESLMSAIAQGEPEAKRRMNDFLEGRASKVTKESS